MKEVYITIVLAPLLGAIIVGLLGNRLGRTISHSIAIAGVTLATLLSFYVFHHHVINEAEVFNENLYSWAKIGSLDISVGFLIDKLTSIMLVVVSFVSLMVHIYTIGYMREDKEYTKFFSYISLFTFAMFVLVMSNNFMQLFFGWEAVGLVSYLLIGFWYKKQSAIAASLKAFLVNRVGDLGLLLGLCLILMTFNSLDYYEVFALADKSKDGVIMGVSVITLICLFLFFGAMGKSAQVPLHVWLPGSMEGPTPISALIHAATMVTAGIFMVSRMSPIFELSDFALTFIMIIGAITALSMGLLGIIQNDIKRVVAYSTLSQLGYMTVALGVSAYSVAIMHLMTHAFFKALLFLAAGSVIVAMHHEQDIRKMGGLKSKMPITYATSLIGTLALIGFPGFSGFFSKEFIIEAVHYSNLPFANIVYYVVIFGVFITALYSLRMFFLVFHGKSRVEKHTLEHLKESPYSITIPLILLAIPSVMIGYFTVEKLLFGNWLDNAISINSQIHHSMEKLQKHFYSEIKFILHAVVTWPFWMMLSGAFCAWWFTIYKPSWADFLKRKMVITNYVLESLYGFDNFNDKVFVKGSKKLGNILWRFSDIKIIDNMFVNGSAKVVGFVSLMTKKLQTGYIYHYAFAIFIGLIFILIWLVFVNYKNFILPIF